MKIVNKKAHFDYEILEVLEAGIVLTGAEAKSARLGHVDMDHAFVKIVGNQVDILNLHIYPYEFADNKNYDPDRTRQLLISKDQLLALANKMKQGRLTAVPTALYTHGPLVKIEIGLARGKKIYEKREAIKKRDLDRDIERELRPKDTARIK